MATYTMFLHEVLDLKPEASDKYEFMRLSDYPIYDEEHRPILNEKILNHYMYQEIGRETVENFLFALRNKMHEIMPFYNQLYETTKREFDPLVTMDIKTTGSSESEEETTSKTAEKSKSDTNAKSRQTQSTFPQQMLSGSTDYATSAVDANSQTGVEADSLNEGEAANKGTSVSDSRTVGYQGSPAMLLQQFRATLLNIDMLVIAELDPLFMMVWNNADNYTQNNGGFRGYY